MCLFVLPYRFIFYFLLSCISSLLCPLSWGRTRQDKRSSLCCLCLVGLYWSCRFCILFMSSLVVVCSIIMVVRTSRIVLHLLHLSVPEGPCLVSPPSLPFPSVTSPSCRSSFEEHPCGGVWSFDGGGGFKMATANLVHRYPSFLCCSVLQHQREPPSPVVYVCVLGREGGREGGRETYRFLV
jgi:hypothetical protein